MDAYACIHTNILYMFVYNTTTKVHAKQNSLFGFTRRARIGFNNNTHIQAHAYGSNRKPTC